MSAREDIIDLVIGRLFSNRTVEDRGHATPCWLWEGPLTRRGYGATTVLYRTYRVHRLAYELLVGPIPDGLTIDHLCGVKDCFNPDHLEPVTAEENSRRAFDRGKHQAAYMAARTRCSQGHEFTPENTARFRGTRGRVCRQCYKARQKAGYRRRRRVA